jgi:hypothetical protein
MDDAFAKEYLHNDLREVRAVLLWKLDGLSEYDIRRPLTSTGTNLLGLVKHLSNTEARYFGDIFGRPFPERLPWWDDDAEFEADKWVTPKETRAEIVDRYRAASAHADATIEALNLDTPGHVPWWPRPNVKLFNVIVHVLNETNQPPRRTRRHPSRADRRDGWDQPRHRCPLQPRNSFLGGAPGQDRRRSSGFTAHPDQPEGRPTRHPQPGRSGLSTPHRLRRPGCPLPPGVSPLQDIGEAGVLSLVIPVSGNTNRFASKRPGAFNSVLAWCPRR